MLLGDTAQRRRIVQIRKIRISCSTGARDDFQYTPLFAVLLQHEQFEGFDATARVRCQERDVQRRQPRKGAAPQRSLLEKVSAIALVVHVLVVHYFSWVSVFSSAMRFT